MRFAHSCIRVRDPDASVRFYRAHREQPYDLGDGYNHLAVIIDDLDSLLESLATRGIQPEREPYSPAGREDVGRICFVRDPDGYRVEPIDQDFPTPQDPEDGGEVRPNT